MSVLARLFGSTRPPQSAQPKVSLGPTGTPSMSVAEPSALPLVQPRLEDAEDPDKKKKDDQEESNAVESEGDSPRDEKKKDDEENACGDEKETKNADGDGSSDTDDDKDKETDMADKNSAAPQATAAQIEKAFGTDPAFCFEVMRDGLSMEAAYEKWTAKLTARLTDQTKTAAGAAKLGTAGSAGVTQPVAPSLRAPAGAAAGNPNLYGEEAKCTTYEALQQCIKTRLMHAGVAPANAESQAHIEAAKKAPDMFEDWKDRQEAAYTEKRSRRTVAAAR